MAKHPTTSATKLAVLNMAIESRARQATKILADLSAEVITEPLRALRHADDAYKAAATMEAIDHVRRVIKRVGDGDAIAALEVDLTDLVVRGGRFPERSTSPCACLAKEELTAAFAEMLALITGEA